MVRRGRLLVLLLHRRSGQADAIHQLDRRVRIDLGNLGQDGRGLRVFMSVRIEAATSTCPLTTSFSMFWAASSGSMPSYILAIFFRLPWAASWAGLFAVEHDVPIDERPHGIGDRLVEVVAPACGSPAC
jgi:hypothetical protein